MSGPRLVGETSEARSVMEWVVVAGLDNSKDEGGRGKRWGGREDEGRDGHGSARKGEG